MSQSTETKRFAAVIRHVPHEGLGLIEQSLARAAVGWRYFHPSELGGSPDPVGRPWHFLIIMGGPASVYDDYRWLDVETGLIRTAVARGVPVLGICLGAQLIAAALGAAVFPCGHKEIGWYGVTLTPEGRDDALLGALGADATVFQWHGDTFDIPAGAVRLASSPLCPNQAFRYAGNVYGLQFHLETGAALVEQWLSISQNISEISEALGAGAVQLIREGAPLHSPRLEEAGAQIFDGFLALG